MPVLPSIIRWLKLEEPCHLWYVQPNLMPNAPMCPSLCASSSTIKMPFPYKDEVEVATSTIMRSFPALWFTSSCRNVIQYPYKPSSSIDAIAQRVQERHAPDVLLFFKPVVVEEELVLLDPIRH